MSCNCKNGSCSTNSNSKTITYEVIQDKIPNELERCFYEYNGLLQLLTQFTSTSPFKPEETRYNAILNEYIERFIQYNLLFDEIVQMAIEDLNIDRFKIIGTSFSFIERVLYLELKEEQTICQM